MGQPRPEREPITEEKSRDHEYKVIRRAEEKFPETPSPSLVKVNRIINYIFTVVEGLIAIRILLKILGANPINAFVSFIYSLTRPFVLPFLSVFNSQTASTGIGVFEFGALLAIAFYVLLNYAIVRLIWIIASRPE